MALSKFCTAESKSVIFFDLNNTLIDPERTFEAAFLATIGEYTGRWDVSGNVAEAALADYRSEWRRLGGKGLAGGPPERRLACLAAALRSLPLAASPGALKALDAGIRRQRELRPQLFPNTLPALSRIAERYRTAVISNGSKEKLLRRLTAAGLAPLLPPERLFAPGPGKAGKPAPELFRRALDAMGAKPDQAVLVGDSRHNDVNGALAAGMDAVWIRRELKNSPSLKKTGKGSILIVRSLNELEKYI